MALRVDRMRRYAHRDSAASEGYVVVIGVDNLVYRLPPGSHRWPETQVKAWLRPRCKVPGSVCIVIPPGADSEVALT